MKIQIACVLALGCLVLTGCTADVFDPGLDAGDPLPDSGLPDTADVQVPDGGPTADAQDGGSDVVADTATTDTGSDVVADVVPDAPTLVCDAGVACGNVCIDTTADDKNCGSCGHDCQGGGCAGSLCLPITLASNQNLPKGIAVDGTSVYWTTMNGGTVAKCATGGCNNTPTTLASGQSGPNGIAVDATSVYWTNFDGNTVMKVLVSGGSLTTLASGPVGGHPQGVAVDASNVYWTTSESTGSVRKVAIGGGTVTDLATSQFGPQGIAVDASNVYWIYNQMEVRKCATGGCGGNPTKITTGNNFASGSGLAVGANNVYWADGKDISKCSANGCGNPTTLATSSNTTQGVAVDATHVYWTVSSTGQVWKVAIGGGNPTLIAFNQNTPMGIAVDTSNVFWTNAATAGQVMKVAK